VIGCSKLDVEVVDFSSNRELENISVVFLEENNVTSNFDKVEPQSIETDRVSGADYSNVYIEVRGCGRVASYR